MMYHSVDNNYYRISYNSLYLLFIFFLSFFEGINISTSNFLYRMSFFVIFIFVLIKVFSEKWRLRELIVAALLLIVILINYTITKKFTLLFTFSILVGLKNVKMDKLIKLILGMRVFSYLSIVLLALWGVIENKQFLFFRDDGLILRHSLGFSKANMAHFLFFLIAVLIVYRYYHIKKVAYFSYLLLFVTNYILYVYTFSRTGYYSVIFLIFLAILARIPALQTAILQMAIYVQIFLISFTILMCTVFNNTPLFRFLNDKLTGRLRFSVMQFRRQVNLFGNYFEFSEHRSIIFDNSYSMIIFLYGLIITFVFLYAYYKTAQHVSYKRNMALAVIFIAISVYMFSERYLFSPMSNYSLFFMAKYFYNELDVFDNKLPIQQINQA